MKAVFSRDLFGSIVVAAMLTACHRTPSPQSRQQETVEAERKAASIEAEMNKDAESESIAKKPDDEPDPPPKEPPPPQ